MQELFRLRIASKRQVTVPQRLMDALGLSEGDELQIEVKDNKISEARACRVVPTDLFSSDVLAALDAREQQIRAGKGRKVNLADTRLTQVIAEMANDKAVHMEPVKHAETVK